MEIKVITEWLQLILLVGALLSGLVWLLVTYLRGKKVIPMDGGQKNSPLQPELKPQIKLLPLDEQSTRETQDKILARVGKIEDRMKNLERKLKTSDDGLATPAMCVMADKTVRRIVAEVISTYLQSSKESTGPHRLP